MDCWNCWLLGVLLLFESTVSPTYSKLDMNFDIRCFSSVVTDVLTDIVLQRSTATQVTVQVFLNAQQFILIWFWISILTCLLFRESKRHSIPLKTWVKVCRKISCRLKTRLYYPWSSWNESLIYSSFSKQSMGREMINHKITGDTYLSMI